MLKVDKEEILLKNVLKSSLKAGETFNQNWYWTIVSRKS